MSDKSLMKEVKALRKELAELKEFLMKKPVSVSKKSPKSPKSSKTVSNVIEVERHSEKSLLVKGPGTFKAKDSLKELGASWNKTLKGWIISSKKENDLKEALESYKTTFPEEVKEEEVKEESEAEDSESESESEEEDSEEEDSDEEDSDSDEDSD